MNRSLREISLLSLVLLFGHGLANAASVPPDFVVPAVSQLDKPQTPQPATEASPQPSAKPPSGPGWIARCTSPSRKGPIECSVEETLVMANTGQFVASVAVRLVPDAHEPVLTVRIPVGLYLPAGLTVKIDDAKPQPVPLQTCDQQSCYGETSVSASFLNALKSGKRLSLTFQNMTKNDIVLPMPLDNFDVAFQKIQ